MTLSFSRRLKNEWPKANDLSQWRSNDSRKKWDESRRKRQAARVSTEPGVDTDDENLDVKMPAQPKKKKIQSTLGEWVN